MAAIYYYGQDGIIVDDELIEIFGLGTKEIKYSDKIGKNVFDMVGFVFRNNKTLVVFPKNYYDSSYINLLNKSHQELSQDIRLLFGVIKKYCETENTSASAGSYMGANAGYDSDYPFKPFYEVYEYYQKYGLYKEKETKIVEGTSWKIDWKSTISKANKIISGGNLIFSPLYVSKKNYNAVFITECMAFIIDHTIENYHDFLCMKKTGSKSKFDFLNNIDYVLMQLKISENTVFKDVNKKLVRSMIEFFEEHRGKARGGYTHVKIRYFDMIWEKMVASFINKHFVGIDSSTGAALFDVFLQTSMISFEDKTYNDIDDSWHHFSIHIDHLAYVYDKLYILDSKYYTSVNNLNYKQLAYNEILRYHYPGIVEINNILLLPGIEHVDNHFSYSAGYIGSRTIGTKIVEQFLSPKNIMEDYLRQ